MDWIVISWTISGPFTLWWISFFRFVLEPSLTSSISILAWVSMWSLTSNFQYHPYSCILRSQSGLRRALSWILSIITVVQWCASFYLLIVLWRRGRPRDWLYRGISYDCLEAMIPGAPGVSHCSPEHLCSNTILFGSPPWGLILSDTDVAHMLMGLFFMYMTMIALLPFMRIALRTGKKLIGRALILGTWAEEFKRSDSGLLVGPASVMLFGLIICGVFIKNSLQWSSSWTREGPVVVDMDCHAVHVGLSPWRYYLDVNEYGRVFRIVKMWFNA